MTDTFKLLERSWPRRAITDAEVRVLAARTRLRTDEVAMLVALPLLLAAVGWLVGAALAWWMRRQGLHADAAARVGVWTFLALGLALDLALLRLMRGARSLERADVHRREVELISAAPGRILDVGTDAHPALLFDCGDGMLLYLGGRFLREPQTFVPARNALASAPVQFPSSRFTVVRAPRSGAVLRIEVGGSALEPEGRMRPPGMRVAMLEWREAEVVDGSLDGTLDGAPVRRSAGAPAFGGAGTRGG